MHVEATTAGPLAAGADTIVVGVFEDEDVAHDLSGNALGELLTSGEARREFKRLAVTHADGVRAILVGLGKRARFDAERARVVRRWHTGARGRSARARCAGRSRTTSATRVVEGLVEGTLLHAYRFERYKPSDDDSREVEKLVLSAHHDVSAPVGAATILANAQNRARDLGNAPANDLGPRRWPATPRSWRAGSGSRPRCSTNRRSGRRKWARLPRSPRAPSRRRG